MSWEAYYLIQNGLKRPHAYDIWKFVKRLKDKGYLVRSSVPSINPSVEVEEQQSVLRFSYGGENLELKMPPKGTSIEIDVGVSEVVWEIFGRYASSHSRKRIFIAYLLRVTWLLVFITILQNIFNGGIMLYRELLIQ